MGKPFDATLKQLLDLFAVDWIDWLAPVVGLPPHVGVDPLDVDLSTVQVSADKVFRLRPPAEGLLHLEPQASHDGGLPDRLLLYNALLHDRYGGPVYSVAILLRREANAKAITGSLSRRTADGTEYLRFGYTAIRVWELHADDLLAGGLGALPLALLTDDAKDRLEELVGQLDRRLNGPDVPDHTRKILLTSSYILSWLRYNKARIDSLFARANAMKESTTYQGILLEGRTEGLREGRQEGQLHALRETLLDVLSDRFGQLPAELLAEVSVASDLSRLRSAIRSAGKAARLADFQF